MLISRKNITNISYNLLIDILSNTHLMYTILLLYLRVLLVVIDKFPHYSAYIIYNVYLYSTITASSFNTLPHNLCPILKFFTIIIYILYIYIYIAKCILNIHPYSYIPVPNQTPMAIYIRHCIIYTILLLSYNVIHHD